MICKIQWVDKNGNPTPDSNSAVALIRCTFTALTRMTGVKHDPSEPIPCCAKHLEQMPNDSWEIVERLDPNP